MDSFIAQHNAILRKRNLYAFAADEILLYESIHSLSSIPMSVI